MKYIYIAYLFCFSISLTGQISISKFSMPSKGETLKLSSTINANVDLGTTGGPQTWDFSGLTQDAYREVSFLDVSEGSETVIGADFMVKTGDFIEQYYSKSDEAIEEIYLKSLDPIFNEFEITNYYADPIVYRKGTIYINNSYNSTSTFQAALAWDVLPDTITSGIGLPIDSIRINTNFNRNDYIDAYGTVMLPDGDWDALRESTTTIRTVTIDVFFLGNWIEAPSEILETFLGDFGDLLAPDTTYSMNFYTDQAIEVLAAFQLNDDKEPTTCEYKSGSQVTETEEFAITSTPSISAFPNPTFGNVTFQIHSSKNQKYKIEVTNILGQPMWNQIVSVNKSSSNFQFDLSGVLVKGTYFYSVFDQNGDKIDTKRLIIITP